MKEEKFFIPVLDTNYEESYNLSYPEWRIKFEKLLQEMEKGNLRYIYLGANTSFFLRFYKENILEEIKINLPLRLKKIGLNTLYYFIPVNVIDSFSLILNFKIIFEELKESFSGERTLYLPYINKLPKGFLALLKGFGIEFIFSRVPVKRPYLIRNDIENDIKIVNVSSDSKIVFLDSFLINEDISKNLFSIEEITSSIPDKGELYEFKSEVKIKKSFPYFKKLEEVIFKYHILNTVLKIENPNISNYYIKEKIKNFLTLYNSENIELLKEEIREIKQYGKKLKEDFLDNSKKFSVFNPLPYKFNYYRIINNKLYKAEAKPFSFSELKEEESYEKNLDFRIYNRGNIKFYELLILTKLIGEKGELKGGIFEEEVIKENFIKTKSKLRLSDKSYDYSITLIPHDNLLKIRGKLKNINKCEILIGSEKNLNIREFSLFELEELTLEKTYSGFLIIDGDNRYLIKTIPGIGVKKYNNTLKLIFEGKVSFDIKKISESLILEYMKYKYKPIIFEGLPKKELSSIFEIKNEDTNFIYMDVKENMLYIYLYSEGKDNIKILFKGKPLEAFIFDLKANKKLDKVMIRDRWVIIPPKKGIFCIGVDIKTFPFSIF